MLKPRGPGGRPRTWDAPSSCGQTILRLAARRGLHLDQVAAVAGVSRACVYGIVSGRTTDPKLSVAYRLASALGVRVEKVFPPATPSRSARGQRNAAR